ncbi:hypothetical protein F66182_8930 [Fusarium sp. NRRL 66182]|nr:hypothetical protein F66182_8930 [Fusarium sp. NRRL 66182]
MMDYVSLYLAVFPQTLLFSRLLYTGARVGVAYFKYSKLTFRGLHVGFSGLGLSVLAIFIATNALLLSIGSKGKEGLGKRNLTIAAVNLMLVILGGKTNPLADLVRIPLSSCYLAHRRIATIATAEALLHPSMG